LGALDEAAAAAAQEQARTQAILLQLLEATRTLQSAAGTAHTQAQPAEQAAPAQQKEEKQEERTTIGRRLELDIFFPQKWDLSKPESVHN
jgi:hypothetical protein